MQQSGLGVVSMAIHRLNTLDKTVLVQLTTSTDAVLNSIHLPDNMKNNFPLSAQTSVFITSKAQTSDFPYAALCKQK